MDYKEKVIALLNSEELSKEQKEKLENIIPELKKFEDDKNKRISKEITQFLKQNNGWNREWLTWLEKQGEQHPHVDVNKMVDKFAHTEVKGHGVPSMIEVDAYRRGIEDALKYCLTYMI